MTTGVSLTRHLLAEEQAHLDQPAQLTGLLTQIAWAAKVIARALRQAGLIDLLGVTGGVNIQGESVKKLDVFANETFIDAFRQMGLVCVVVSEEMEGPFLLAEDCERAGYALFIDPLDGSSNLDVNGAVGSIFSVHRRRNTGIRSDESDLLRPGSAQVAAGYVLYGPSTVLVYTAGQSVYGFTLDTAIGEFLLSQESVRVPSRGRTYSVNEGNSRSWPPAVRKFIDALKEPDPVSGRPYSSRYSGALVADLHRTLLEGGSTSIPRTSPTRANRRGSSGSCTRPRRWPS
jgi:fructose-1,6-bisphosphatase I